MQFEKMIVPQYRESGADGLIGLKGYMCYCQDVATWHMHGYDMGNDYLIDRLGIAWMHTKSRIKIYKKADYSSELLVETGTTSSSKVRVCRDFRITQGGELLALSRLESCLFDLKDESICRISDLGFDFNVFDEPFEDLEHRKLKKITDGMEKVYEYKILYSDLDKSMHMNNLHFTDMFMNVFGPDFYEKHDIREYDINYISQGRFGDTLSVYMRQDGSVCDLVAVNGQGKAAAASKIVFSG